MVIYLLYRLLKRSVSIFFNILNFLLAGNLPPFGCVAVVVQDQGRYLVVERPEGGLVFPGGFMRWHEGTQRHALRNSSSVRFRDVIVELKHVPTTFTG